MPTDPNEAQKSKLTSVAFVQDFNLLYQPVSLNKHGPFWFILDTGAQATIIDSEVAKRARVEYQGINGQAGGAGASRSLKIAAVADKSPAAQAGLFAEDQLLEIEGKPVQSFSIEELYRSLSKPKAWRLLIQRGQERLRTLKPQPLP